MASTDDIDLYAILGVSPQATPDEIKQAWKKRTSLIHPDRHGGDEAASEWAKDLAQAKDILLDPAKRAKHDAARRRRQERREPPPPPPPRRDPPPPPPPPRREPPRSPAQNGRQIVKVVLTAEQARTGCEYSWQWISNGVRITRQLTIPPGVTNGQTLQVAAYEIGGVLFPEAVLLVIVQPPAAPPQRPADPPTSSSRNATRDEPEGSPWWGWVAGAAAVLLVAGAGWWFFVGGGQDEEQAAPSPSASSTPSLSATSAPRNIIPSPEASSAPPNIIPSRAATSAPPSGSSSPPLEVLQTLAAESATTVDSWPVGSWVPQLSAKCAGMQTVDRSDANGRIGYPNGSPETYLGGIDEGDILEFHAALNERFDGTILLVTADPSESLPCSRPPLWVSVADFARPTKAEIQAWCAARELPTGECLPALVSSADGGG